MEGQIKLYLITLEIKFEIFQFSQSHSLVLEMQMTSDKNSFIQAQSNLI